MGNARRRVAGGGGVNRKRYRQTIGNYGTQSQVRRRVAPRSTGCNFGQTMGNCGTQSQVRRGPAPRSTGCNGNPRETKGTQNQRLRGALAFWSPKGADPAERPMFVRLPDPLRPKLQRKEVKNEEFKTFWQARSGCAHRSGHVPQPVAGNSVRENISGV